MPKLKRNNTTTEHKIWVRAARLSLPRALFICSHRIKPQSTQTHQGIAALKGGYEAPRIPFLVAALGSSKVQLWGNCPFLCQDISQLTLSWRTLS